MNHKSGKLVALKLFGFLAGNSDFTASFSALKINWIMLNIIYSLIFKGLYFLKMETILDGLADNFGERYKTVEDISYQWSNYLNFNAKPKIQILNKL